MMGEKLCLERKWKVPEETNNKDNKDNNKNTCLNMSFTIVSAKSITTTQCLLTYFTYLLNPSVGIIQTLQTGYIYM